MKKRLLSCGLITVMMLSMVACGNSKDVSKKTTETGQNTEATTSETTTNAETTEVETTTNETTTDAETTEVETTTNTETTTNETTTNIETTETATTQQETIKTPTNSETPKESEKPIETPKPSEEPSEEPSTSNVPADYSPTALYDYNDPMIQKYISQGTPYPTVDYNTVPVVDITPMVQPEKMGENCSGLSNLSTKYLYDYDRYDYTKRLTWNSEIPMHQYIIWDDKLGFFTCDNSDYELYKKLLTTDFEMGLQLGTAHQIIFGSNVAWSDDGNCYYFIYLTEW